MSYIKSNSGVIKKLTESVCNGLLLCRVKIGCGVIIGSIITYVLIRDLIKVYITFDQDSSLLLWSHAERVYISSSLNDNCSVCSG